MVKHFIRLFTGEFRETRLGDSEATGQMFTPKPDFDTAIAALKEIAKRETMMGRPTHEAVIARAALDALGVEWGK